jgi:hypothetical protein
MNILKPGCIPKIIIKDNISSWEQIENIEKALKVGPSLKIHIIGIGARDIHEGKVTPILGLLWQIVRVRQLALYSFNGIRRIYYQKSTIFLTVKSTPLWMAC